MSATQQTPPPPQLNKIANPTLSSDVLALLLEQAATRGAEQALSRQHGDHLDMAQAAAYVYGRSDRVEAFRALRLRYPEIDAASIGSGRFRRFQRASLDNFLTNKPQFRRRAEKQGGQS